MSKNKNIITKKIINKQKKTKNKIIMKIIKILSRISKLITKKKVCLINLKVYSIEKYILIN